MTDFPFINNIDTGLDDNDLPVFCMYDWDFKTNQFKRDNHGELILLKGDDALKVWIRKALKTERYNYLAYTYNYGMELHRLIGKVIGVGERRSELKRYLTEALMVNPYIKSIDKIELSESGTDLSINISLTTIYGEIKI